jgi:hypothetical protein
MTQGLTFYVRPAVLHILAVGLACYLGTPAAAFAQSVPQQTAVIQDSSFTEVLGIVKVNQAAGAGNVQANLAILSGSPVHVTVTQATDGGGTSSGDAEIIGTAFSNASGILQINQAAGFGNAHANVAILEYGLSADQMTDNSLKNVAPTQQAALNAAPSNGLGNIVRAGSKTFAGSSGIVQVNQTAGTANTVTNSFLLQVQQGSIGP